MLLRRAAEFEATVAREGIEFGVLSRESPSAVSSSSCRGSAGEYDEIFLPLHGAHQAHNAALRPGGGRGVPRWGPTRAALDLESCGRASRATSPGRLEVVRRQPDRVLDAAHNPAGRGRSRPRSPRRSRFTRLVGVVGVMADKDARGILEALEPVLDEVVVTRASSPRAMPADELAAVAVEVFGAGPGRGRAARPRRDRRRGRPWPRRTGDDFAGAGVLVTGSVVTVGEARTLLGGR